MRENQLKARIKRGESVIGTFVKIKDPLVVEVLALAGFDFFVLDTEHVAMDRMELTNILRAAECFGITPLVRVRENQQVEILQNLDLGYMGVQVPDVDTAQQAEELVQSVKYYPRGVRGLSPSVRACDYGTDKVSEYIAKANENTMVVAHCESGECVKNLDEILKVEGVDVIFIGPMDLSQSLGVPGDTGSEIVQSTARGAQYILLASDQAMILNWGKKTLADIRAAKEG